MFVTCHFILTGRLVGHVLNGYLNLRRLVLQRTRLVEETQELLLQLLGDMTTGTEAETKQFMSVCVQTLRQCLSDDLVTPVFIVERLCSIIHPEEKDDAEFLLSLDKDPQQEDFLQGNYQSLQNEFKTYIWNGVNVVLFEQAVCRVIHTAVPNQDWVLWCVMWRIRSVRIAN